MGDKCRHKRIKFRHRGNIDEGIKHGPGFYKLGTSKIKNENARKVLESNVTNYIVEETQKKQKRILIICSVGYKK